MPVQLTNPETKQKPTVSQEIVWFGVDTQALHVDITINDYDEDGVVNDSRTVRSPLTSDGTPRFEATMYADLKAFLYQIAAEDGYTGEGTLC